VATGLAGIAIKAKADSKCRFTALAHILTPEFLKETWQQMNRQGASGVDGETCAQFEGDLDGRVVRLWERLKAGQYQAPPVRRVDIPNLGATSETRPLGIPTVEDRVLQRAVARILSAIYEQDFVECSYGYRPGRNPHQALRALRSYLIGGKVMHVYETDIRGYFTRICRGPERCDGRANGIGYSGATSRADRGLNCRVRRLCIRRSEEAET